MASTRGNRLKGRVSVCWGSTGLSAEHPGCRIGADRVQAGTRYITDSIQTCPRVSRRCQHQFVLQITETESDRLVGAMDRLGRCTFTPEWESESQPDLVILVTIPRWDVTFRRGRAQTCVDIVMTQQSTDRARSSTRVPARAHSSPRPHHQLSRSARCVGADTIAHMAPRYLDMKTRRLSTISYPPASHGPEAWVRLRRKHPPHGRRVSSKAYEDTTHHSNVPHSSPSS